MSDKRHNPAKAARHGSTEGGDRGTVVPLVLAVVLVLVGAAWMITYVSVADEGDALPWMTDLARWNFLIGFGLVFLGLMFASARQSPLGRGRGVVVGMLGSFLIGLVWILTYYVTGGTGLPVMGHLQQYNLLVGIGWMALGFVYATKWE